MQGVLLVLTVMGALTAAQHRVSLSKLFDKEDDDSRTRVMESWGLEPLRLNRTYMAEILLERDPTLSVDSVVLHGLSTMERDGEFEIWTTQGGELRTTFGLLFKNLTMDINGMRRGYGPMVSTQIKLSGLSFRIHDGLYLSDNTCTRDVRVEFGPLSSAAMLKQSKGEVDVTVDVTETFNQKLQELQDSDAFKTRLQNNGLCPKLGLTTGQETALSTGRRSNKFNLNPLTDRVLEVANVMIKAKGLQWVPMGDVTEGDMKMTGLKMGDLSTLERRGDSWMRTMPDNMVQFRFGVGLDSLKFNVDDMEDEGESTGPMRAVMRGPTLMLQATIKITDVLQFDELDIQVERVERATLFRGGRGADITDLVNKQVGRLNKAFQGELGTKINQALRDNTFSEMDSDEIEKALEKYFTSSEEN